jgi:VWFA-related protein
MKKKPSLALALVLSLVTSAVGQKQNQAQQSPPPQQQQKQSDEDVVRITTNLVQVDAVVTDKSGKTVTDLRPEDFEIYEDNRPQKITNFSYFSTENGATRPAAVSTPAPVDKTAPPVPPVRLRPEQVRRTFALVVDDLGLSFESTYYVRRALKKFVDEQMQPGDLIAIVRTAGGMGALQQFTSDKRQLYAAIERVKWNPIGRGGVSAFAPIEGDSLQQSGTQLDRDANDSSSASGGPDAEELREDMFTVGTLGALGYVVRGMRELPGRKSILLMSDGIKIFRPEDPTRSARILDVLRRLTDQANRASVVIYTIDPRGLQTLGLTAADNVASMSPADIEQKLSDRRSEFFESQNGLNYLAVQTGGFPLFNSNDLSGGIRRVLEDQKGYYLIGYRPEESTFDPKTGRRSFHKILIKVKRPGLQVRSRTGFYGVTDEEAAPQRRTPAQQLIGALTSPFAESGIHLRLTSLFGNDAKLGSFVRSLLHIDGHDLTFTDEPDGWHKAVFDVLAVTFGDNGAVVDQSGKTQTLRARGETYKRFLEQGIVYVLTFPVKKPGAYQLRTAIRDSSSEHVGSASQFIEVPNIAKNHLTLSGIIVSGTDPSAKPKTAGKEEGSEALTPDAPPRAAEEGVGETDPQAGPAVRKFRRGTILRYGYVIYNAQADKATMRPQLQTQIRVFRDGKQIFTGREQPFDATGQPDFRRVIAGGAFQLGTEMIPGEYILQVIVTDPLAKEKYRVATQWIDFEIVK